jgi:hypothetical protein
MKFGESVQTGIPIILSSFCGYLCRMAEQEDSSRKDFWMEEVSSH